jgi:hypothetical protein
VSRQQLDISRDFVGQDPESLIIFPNSVYFQHFCPSSTANSQTFSDLDPAQNLTRDAGEFTIWCEINLSFHYTGWFIEVPLLGYHNIL